MPGIISAILMLIGAGTLIWGAYKLTSWAEKKLNKPIYHDIENKEVK